MPNEADTCRLCVVPKLQAAATGQPDVPVPLDALFRRMLARRPQDRPRTMSEIISALQTL